MAIEIQVRADERESVVDTLKPLTLTRVIVGNSSCPETELLVYSDVFNLEAFKKRAASLPGVRRVHSI